MASTTKSRYDVFISFKGDDTRNGFTDHLYHALVQAGLSTFRDDEEIERGQELKQEIKTAIIESRAYVVVLSENYANSTWCLDELCLIMEQRKEHNHLVLPVFYHVNPSDVRNHRGSFAIKRSKLTMLMETADRTGFSEDSKLTSLMRVTHLNHFSDKRAHKTKANVSRWREALADVGYLSGIELTGSQPEGKLMTELVEKIKRKLDLKQPSTPTHLIGMEAQVGVINSLLKTQHSNVIAICGMGGSGKTTIAQHVYNLNKQDFRRCSFIQEIGKQPQGLLEIQKQILKDAYEGHQSITSVSEGTQKIQTILQLNKMLIVLDDITQQEQLSVLLGTKTFPTQSKIIITTTILNINAWFDTIQWNCCVHKLNLLNDRESIELLSWHAFRSKTPMKDFEELVEQLAQYCGGNPLALKVLGSSLFVSDEYPRAIINMKEIWRSRINSLNSLNGNIHYKMKGVLRKSLDTLPHPSERELFLHIACFFVGEYKDVVETLLEDELYAKSGILSLINRCLITISPDCRLMMHQQLQEMGRNVVCEEFKDPIKRSRVWHDAESYSLLRKGDGSHIIEGLSLDMRNVEQEKGSKELVIETTSFEKMDKLKLLQLKYVKLTGSYDNFPKLKWLCWHGCPLQAIPSGLLMSTLVVIDMSDGNLEKFEAPTVLHSLKRLDLTRCDKLVSICNLNRLPKLETLILWNCSNLTICNSLADLENLDQLDMGGCTKLWKYLNQPETTIHSKQLSIKRLGLSNCGLEFNSDVCGVFHAKSNANLNLAGNPFEYLPIKIIDLRMLRILHLYSCPNLKSVSCIPSTLEELNVDWCTSLESVTFESGRFTLRGFAYECCLKLTEVQGLFKLVPIAEVDETDLCDHMQWIKLYANHKVDLVGDEITEGRIWHTQMLYEYGIMSTYLQGINGESMPAYDFTSSTNILSFRVPFRHGKTRIQGLNVFCLYRSLEADDKDVWNLWAKVSNITKGLSWVYNPMVYCKPRIDEDVAWISYWPIGNILDVGDEVNVHIYLQTGTQIDSRCGASLVYIDREVDVKKTCKNNSMTKKQEVIGGDLSKFEVIQGHYYYLCRHDFFGSSTSNWFKYFFGINNVNYPDSQGWRKTHKSNLTRDLRVIANTFLKTIELEVNFYNRSDIDKIEKAVSNIAGVESVSARKRIGKLTLTVTGHVDPVQVATCVREFDNIVVEILSVKPKF